jgi:hypothetical protein
MGGAIPAMNETVPFDQQERQREGFIDAIARDHGMEGLRKWLLTYAESDVDWSQARRALRLLSDGSPETWLADVVRLAVEAVSEGVRHRVRHWELESVIHGASEAEREVLLSRIRIYFREARDDWAINAARCLWSVGYRYDGAGEELSALFPRLDRSTPGRAIVVNTAAYLGAISSNVLDGEVDGLIKASVGYNRNLVFLIANHGSADAFPYLDRHYEAHGHDVLMAMLQMCLRVERVRESTLQRFLSAYRNVRWGLDHFAIRVFDSPELINQYINEAFAALVNNGPALPEMTLLKSCVRESHLDAMGSVGDSLSPVRRAVLRTSVEELSEHRGLVSSHSTFRKTAAIDLSSRLGISELRAWLPHGMQGEVNRGLMQRMAQDCCFFNIRDFIVPLSEVLKLEGDSSRETDEDSESDSSAPGALAIDNPMWLVSDEAGVSGGETTLRILLESDGRHGMDEALMSYVEGLAFAAVNLGTTRLLTEAMLDDRQPSWRRRAAAHAVRTANLYDPVPQTDWKQAEAFVLDLSQARFSRHELLIALAENDPAAAARVISSLPPEESGGSQALLARVIARFEIEAAVNGLARYLGPVQYPHKSDFEQSYAAICVARLYEAGEISGDEATRYIRNGLQYELAQFCISCKCILDKDESLFRAVWSGTLERNSSWSSYSYLWKAVGKFRPKHLLSPEAFEHVPARSDASVRGYLDALLEQRDKLDNRRIEAWPLLLRLMRDGSRAVGWYSAFVASMICPELSKEFVRATKVSDLDLRIALECALWLDEETWQVACNRSESARWRVIADYAEEISAERERLRMADVYLLRIHTSEDRLRDWRYAQALLRLPSEKVLLGLQEWTVSNIQDGYLSNWLCKETLRAFKKNREELFKKSRLPGEQAFARWF